MHKNLSYPNGESKHTKSYFPKATNSECEKALFPSPLPSKPLLSFATKVK
jgi:hypothetical protein